MGSTLSTPVITHDLVTAFVANNSKRTILVCSSGDYAHWSSNTAVGGEHTPETPSIVQFQSKLWVAFKADSDNHALLISCSSDEKGTSWSANTKIGQATKCAPSLCVFKGKLWVAFIADNSSNNILVCSSEDGVRWTNNTVVGQTSPFAPSLCVFNDRLWIAFAANNDQNANAKATSENPNPQVRDVLICSSEDGARWTNNTKIGQTTKAAPSLCAFQNKLRLAFVASNQANELLICSSSDGQSWSGNTKINQASPFTPNLAAVSDRMYVAFVSNNDKRDLLCCTTTDGTGWSGSVNMNQDSGHAPALTARESVLGTVRPKFQVITILYAPPGANGGKGTSQVVYANGSSAGTTHSISDSFKGSVEITARIGDDKAWSGGGTFSYSNTSTDTSTLDVKKSETKTITVTGPNHDGLNHDYDVFYVCTNPLYTITKTNGFDVRWELGIDGSEMKTLTLYAGWLNGKLSRPSQIDDILRSANLTEEDLATILATNPFGQDHDTGSTAIDTTRYVDTGQGYSYLPAPEAGATPPTFSDRWENTISTSQSHSTQLQYTASGTFTQGVTGLWSVKETAGFQITHTNTLGTSSSSTQSASFTVGGPSSDYKGTGVYLKVYWDTLFNTFMFKLADAAATYGGSVTDQNGQPYANQTVKLAVAGKTYTTTTDSNGNYQFAGTPSGAATVSVGGKSLAAVKKQTIKVGDLR
ncbi:MAG: carboxypeptidase-like regulatory domain-containing protein [Polyangiaceae bacterium]